MSAVDDELDRLWAMPRSVPCTTELLGWPMQLADGPSFVSQYREIFVAEIYDFPARDASPVIIDGGANIGMATIWWLARWPDARIVAFEPDPVVFGMLADNLRHQPSERLELRRAALSTSALGVQFVPDGADGGRLVAPAPDAPADAGGPEPRTLDVTTQSLADLLESLGHVDLLKLDIEGAETDVLQESAAELGRVDRAFIEYHSFAGSPQSLPEMLDVLRAAGFRLYVESPVTSVRPFLGVAAHHGIDLQLNVWAYRTDTDRVHTD